MKENQIRVGVIITNEQVDIIKRKIKRIHGSYYEDESLAWNILNFIQCSAWNHRWGRRFSDELREKYTKELIVRIDNEMGRNKNLLSYNRKIKHNCSELRKENNRLKQLLQNEVIKCCEQIKNGELDPYSHNAKWVNHNLTNQSNK